MCLSVVTVGNPNECVYIYLTVCLFECLYPYLCVHVYLSLSVCMCVYTSVCLYLSACVCLCVYICLSVCVPVSVCPPVCVCLFVYICLSVFVPVSVCPPACLYLSVCVCVQVELLVVATHRWSQWTSSIFTWLVTYMQSQPLTTSLLLSSTLEGFTKLRSQTRHCTDDLCQPPRLDRESSLAYSWLDYRWERHTHTQADRLTERVFSIQLARLQVRYVHRSATPHHGCWISARPLQSPQDSSLQVLIIIIITTLFQSQSNCYEGQQVHIMYTEPVWHAGQNNQSQTTRLAWA